MTEGESPHAAKKPTQGLSPDVVAGDAKVPKKRRLVQNVDTPPGK